MSTRILPDWNEMYTASETEQEFDLKLSGSGWYKKKNDWLLVLPAYGQDSIPVDKKIYHIYAYLNTEDPRELFKSIANLPGVEI